MKKLAFIFILLPFLIFSQSGKLKKADNYYNKIAYAAAIPLYEDVCKSELANNEIKSKLAYCYLQVGKISESEKLYGEIILSNKFSNLDLYNYAAVLKQIGKYQESDFWMKKYHEKEISDSRAKEFIENENYIERIERSGNKFSIKNLSSNSENSDFGAYMFKNKAFVLSTRRDKKSVKRYWAWNNKLFLDMYIADMDSTLELSNFKLMTKRVNTKFHEGPICFSPDGKKVYYTRNNISMGNERRDEKGIQNLKLYVADVIQENIWINEKEFIYNSKDFSIGHPTISIDGKFLYFASDMPGGKGGADIYRVEILGENKFGKPENLGTPINTEGHEMFPFINQENLLFFASDGHVGLGGLDVFVGIQNSSKKFEKILNVGKPVNSKRDDFAFIIDSNGKKGYFSTNREEGKGDDDIYSFSLTRPFNVGVILKGVVKDKQTNQILANTQIELLENNVVIGAVITDDNGEYEFIVEENKDYSLLADHKLYANFQDDVSSKNTNSYEIIKNIDLEKMPEISLYCVVNEKETNMPIEGVTVRIENYNDASIIADQKTNEFGNFSKDLNEAKVGDELNYKIIVEKKGYLTKTHLFTFKIEREGRINLNEYLDFSIGVAKVGTDLASLIDIKPIYFDLGKYNIRKDAAVELDKIVKVMNDYPNMVIELGSHTDCRSSKAFNLKLSDNRAKASAKYIKSRIVKPERIYGKGYGESKLKNGCACEGSIRSSCTEEEHQENRRTEFIIKKMD